MDADDVKLVDFLGQNKTRFIIPVYQRNYDWKTEHCKQLLDDIIECGRNKKTLAHFLGSVVYIHDDIFSSAKIRELTIIDGQQRLTTLTLIWLVIYKLAVEMGNEERKEDILESCLINKRESEKLKLRPTENNDKALQFLMNSDDKEEFPHYSRLIDNYRYFRSRINGGNVEIVLRGLEKLMFVEISLEREKDDPQRIFESLNSTGLELSQADLIRNYILMGLRRNDQQMVYEKYWLPIEKLAREESTNNSRVSDFIRDFLTLKTKKIPNKQRVYHEFKSTYSFNTINELEPILIELKRYVRHYTKFINVDKEPDLKIREQLRYINHLEINVSYPFLLQVFEDYDNKLLQHIDLVNILSLIESFVWRRFLVGVPTNALNKIFLRLYEDIDANNYVDSLRRSLLRKKGSQRFPRDSEVRSSVKERDVYNIQTKNRTFLLERLENFNNTEPVIIENNPHITVEHIFPQNPDSRWKQDLSSEEYTQLSEVYLHTLANLTLSGNNGNLGNKIFVEKRDLPEKGYRHSKLFLNRHLGNIERWDINAINERFEKLITRLFEIWPCPVILDDELVTSDEVSIFDAEDPTNKKLDYAIFLEQKLQSSKVADLYTHVFTTLFDLDGERFFATDLAEKVQVTNKPETLRSPKALNEICFIETNLSNKDKFERLKYALNIFEFTDDLYIRYAS